ncbi:MAG: hypothetical protein IJU98_00305, partial [Synergistaceae bacterium]|nr:hypothetical protein [Synergistaceae bacterium]
TAFITADATEADAATLNEVVAESGSSETKSGSSSSSGGCDAGLGLGALGLFAVGGAAFLKPWRRK